MHFSAKNEIRGKTEFCTFWLFGSFEVPLQVLIQGLFITGFRIGKEISKDGFKIDSKTGFYCIHFVHLLT